MRLLQCEALEWKFQTNKGNIKARERMVAQYAIAGETGCAVIGTDHATKSVTGFPMKFGGWCCGYHSVIASQ